ncbi:type VI secretion system contractile sheath domain-containing protein [Viridibacterium curvum]|uniref:TssC1 N-terminal domain-containing protein n=1 Tax=Viridibacterium curvum TaxID=1101404 RepID=A0ABP9QPR0_9RHOO
MAGMQFEFTTGPGRKAAQAERREEGPLRILLLGDFSGLPAGERTPLAQRKTCKVDIDNFDNLLARLAPRATLAAGSVQFANIDDFHPDALYQRLPLFQALREARSQPPSAASDLLGGLLGGNAAPAASTSSKPASPLDTLIRSVVAPHILPDTTSETRAYTAAVDAAIAEQMRAVLHDPAFQSLEANWRGVQWLLRELELDENLQLHLFDVTRDELLADIVNAGGQLAQSGLHAALADRWRSAPDGEPWSLLAGLYKFGPSDLDIGLLAALGLIASQAGGPFIAAGDMALVGEEDDATLNGWRALRRSQAAPWIGLTAPRLLLRLPYGKGSDAIESFAFEELGSGEPEHEHLLWGAGSLGATLLIGRAFAASGWDFSPGDERELGDLPAWVFTRDGERELQACAERYLGETAATALLEAGLMPLLSHRNSNAVTLLRFQSISEPASALAGLG